MRFPLSPLRGSPVVRATESMGTRPWLHRFGPSGLGALKATMLGRDCRLLGYEGEGHGFFNQGRPKYFETRDAMIAF